MSFAYGSCRVGVDIFHSLVARISHGAGNALPCLLTGASGTDVRSTIGCRESTAISGFSRSILTEGVTHE